MPGAAGSGGAPVWQSRTLPVPRRAAASAIRRLGVLAPASGQTPQTASSTPPAALGREPRSWAAAVAVAGRWAPAGAVIGGAVTSGGLAAVDALEGWAGMGVGELGDRRPRVVG